jgi:L-arabinose isomerase
MTGEWLAHCAACPVPEIANVFNGAGIRLPPDHRGAGRRSRPAGARSTPGSTPPRGRRDGGNRLGLMGHYYGGMLDI